jgi:hypothetical protein
MVVLSDVSRIKRGAHFRGVPTTRGVDLSINIRLKYNDDNEFINIYNNTHIFSYNKINII